MGAWAHDAFGNDEACDWAGGFADDPSIAKVEKVLDTLLAEQGYLDSYFATTALVACEIVARLQGHWGPRNAYSEAVDQWVEASSLAPSPQLVDKAIRSIDRILGDDSELRDLWDDGARNDKWHAEMDSLRSRVRVG